MELKVMERKGGKTESKRLRREGNVPAIFYSQGKEGERIIVEGIELKKILQKMPQGSLPTTIFTLDFQGKQRKAIVKDIQYNITTYDVIHVDFIELLDNVNVELNVPIRCLGSGDCVGVKLGGNWRQVNRFLKVRCLPKDIPASFEIDVRDLGLGESKKLSDIMLPSGVKPLTNLNEIVATVAKKL